MRALLGLWCAVVFAFGCGGSGPDSDISEGDAVVSDVGVVGGDVVEPPLADPVTFELNFEEGEVQVPNGVAVEKVINGFGEAYVSSGGFYLETAVGARQLAVALSPGGKPVVMGWFGRADDVINARSTAEVLAFYALGAARVSGDAEHLVQVMELLGDARPLDAVASAINAALVADPTGFSATENTTVAAALEAAIETILGLDLSANAPPNALLVNPASELSGMSIDQSGAVNAFAVMNRYRRRARAIVERVSTFKDGVETASPAKQADITVLPVDGMPGVTGTIVQIIRGTQEPGGLYASENVAYVPKKSEVVEVPNVEGADKTRYRVLVVGPGRQQGDYGALDANEQAAQREASIEFTVRDYLLPFLLHMVIPPSQAVDVMNTPAGDQVVDAFIRVITDDTELHAASVAGSLSKVGLIAIGGGAAQAKLIDVLHAKLFQKPGEVLVKGKMYTAVKAFAVVSASTTLLLKLADAGFIEADLTASNKADIWTIDVEEPLVRLDPPASTVAPGQIVALTVNIPGADDGVFEYRFSTPGEFGTLQSGHKRGDEITSSVGAVIYDAMLPGAEEVEVVVYEVQGSERVELGSGIATVTVSGVGVLLNPRVSEVEPFGRLALSARAVADELPETLRFRWTTTGVAGTFEGEAVVEATVEGKVDHNVAFVAGFEPGEATVTVEVFGPTDEEAFATATATIDVRPFKVTLEPLYAALELGAEAEVTAIVQPRPPRGELSFAWTLVGEGTIDGAATVTHSVPSGDRDGVTYKAPAAAPPSCVQHVTATITLSADGKSVTMPPRTARMAVDCPAEVELLASAVDVEVEQSATLTATIAGTAPPGPLTYTWGIESLAPEGATLQIAGAPVSGIPITSNTATLQAGSGEGYADIWVTVSGPTGPIGTASTRIMIDRQPCQGVFPLEYWQREAGGMTVRAEGRWGGRVTVFVDLPPVPTMFYDYHDVDIYIPQGVGGTDDIQVTGDVRSIGNVRDYQQWFMDINRDDDPPPPRLLLDGAVVAVDAKGSFSVSMPTYERHPACESYRYAPSCCPNIVPDERYGPLLMGPIVGVKTSEIGQSIAIIESN